MNFTIWLVFSSSKFDHITPLLKVHWLKAPELIQYKLIILAWKCCGGTAPTYLDDELFPPTNLGIRSAHGQRGHHHCLSDLHGC